MRGTKGGEIAKLFAKHFKIKEREFGFFGSMHQLTESSLTEAEYLGRTLVAGGVGTAGRIGKLLGETGEKL
jgi:protein CMS1